MHTRIQKACVLSAPFATIIYIFAFAVIAGFVPPSDPTMGADALAQFYANDTNAIRAGQLIGMVASIFYLPWYAFLAVHMARIEGRYPILSVTQFTGGAILVVYFILCSMLWTVAAYRPDMPEAQLLMVHDASWLTFVMVYPEYTLQLVCVGIVGLMDKRPQPLLPRWVCFFNFWVAATAICGGFASFFKTGPFAYNGVFAFWFPVAFFIIWLCVMVPALWRGIDRIRLQEEAEAV